MHDPKGLSKFRSALLDVVKTELINPTLAKNNKRIRESIARDLFDEEDLALYGITEDPDEAGMPTPREQFLRKLLDGLVAIMQSFEVLDDIQLYIGRFPYDRGKVSRTRYLRFHFEAYLHEVFVLQERMLKFLKSIRRAYRKDRRASDIDRVSIALEESVRRSLKGVSDVRSAHVHERRIREKTLDRLGFLELLLSDRSDGRADDEFTTYVAAMYRIRHREAKSHWKRIIKNNNTAVEKLLDLCFAEIYKLCFDSQGRILFPDSLQS